MHLREALRFMHGKNIVHCDLSSNNIFVTADGTLKIGGFGAARIIETEYKENWNLYDNHAVLTYTCIAGEAIPNTIKN